MKALVPLLYFVCLNVVVRSYPFVGRKHASKGLGIRNFFRGGSRSNTPTVIASDTTDDYERAERAILMSIEKVEAIVEKAVANEVDILFHTNDHAEKDTITSHTKKAVADGANKIKSAIKSHSEKSLYPFETKHQQQLNSDKGNRVHKDHRVLHAIEAAERAVLQAITNEVDTLFHETVHDPTTNPIPVAVVEQTKTTVNDGIIKASTVVDNVHNHRRDWLHTVSTSMIEEYAMPEFFLE